MTWVIERDAADWLNSIIGMKIFVGIAPENAKEPFGVLQMISTGSVRSLSFFHPLLQLDVFGENPQEAISKAEAAIGMIDRTDAQYGSTLFDSIRAERASLIHVEDGTWKVPIEITANCIRRQ